ncbi:MAG: hypothetical protein M3321_09560 [Actinomycetota bacterium]|nr:hypothetical protein [Actinomycetota bacterium]
MEVETDARLNEKELDVLNHIGSAYYAFAELDVYHPADHDEFVFHVHALGRIVMARSAARAHPERGWIKKPAAETP